MFTFMRKQTDIVPIFATGSGTPLENISTNFRKSSK
jgi:hypothetical protein